MLAALLLGPRVAVAQAEKKVDPNELRAKTCRTAMSGGKYVKGVVDKLDADTMVLVAEDGKTGEVLEYTLVPTDVLRDGETSETASGRFSHRWKDLKVGDTVEVRMNTDHIDKLTYCVELCIWERPKGKLPPWQKMDNPENKKLFLQLSLLNDLTNGDDVSDEEIQKAFPPTPEVKDFKGYVLRPAYPGGLPKQWQEKLDTIRAKKKEQELKATPPKKEDKK